MIHKKTILILLLLFVNLFSRAQKPVVLDHLRCWSTQGPIMQYWHSAAVQKSFAHQLQVGLQKYHGASFNEASPLPIRLPVTQEDFAKSAPSPIISDTSTLHLHLDISETSAEAYFTKYKDSFDDSLLIQRTKSVFQLFAVISFKDSIVYNSSLDIFISKGSSMGMGIVSNTVGLTPTGFSEMLKAGLGILLDPAKGLGQIEVKAAPAYLLDNYIFPLTTKQPRIFVTSNKGISQFTYLDNPEMIRQGQEIYEAIRLKGKNPDKLPSYMEEAIRNTTNFAGSDYVYLRQEGRDVIRNRNYLLKLLVQVNPDAMPDIPLMVFDNYIRGPVHHLISEKDTLARFGIEKMVKNEVLKIYPASISNGYDSSAIFHFDNTLPQWPVVYDYVVSGNIMGHVFAIKCSGMRNTLKEIFLDEKLVCIAQGKHSVEKFVVFDASLSPELLNPLFLIGFNVFFE